MKVFRPNRLKRSRRRFQPFGESANTQKMNHKMKLARLDSGHKSILRSDGCSTFSLPHYNAVNLSLCRASIFASRGRRHIPQPSWPRSVTAKPFVADASPVNRRHRRIDVPHDRIDGDLMPTTRRRSSPLRMGCIVSRTLRSQVPFASDLEPRSLLTILLPVRTQPGPDVFSHGDESLIVDPLAIGIVDRFVRVPHDSPDGGEVTCRVGNGAERVPECVEVPVAADLDASSSFLHSWVMARLSVPASRALPRLVMKSSPKFAGSSAQAGWAATLGWPARFRATRPRVARCRFCRGRRSASRHRGRSPIGQVRDVGIAQGAVDPKQQHGRDRLRSGFKHAAKLIRLEHARPLRGAVQSHHLL